MSRYSMDVLIKEALESARIKIAVVGIGGCGCNIINNLERSGIKVPTIAINTDATSLANVRAKHKILIGYEITKGRGSAGSPELGYKIMMSEINKIEHLIRDIELVINVAGLGGGTGTGGIVALTEYIKNNFKDKLVWNVVTLPFQAEGEERYRNARNALTELLELSDLVIVNSNDILKRKLGMLSIQQAFKSMDMHLLDIITGIVNLGYVTPMPGFLTVDYSNIEKLTRNAKLGYIGIGKGTTPLKAFENALQNNFCEADITGCRGVIVYVEGTQRMLKTIEIEEIPRILSERFNISTIYWGVKTDWKLHDVKVMLIASNVKSPYVENYLKGMVRP